jgi:prephenate dehydrogenase
VSQARVLGPVKIVGSGLIGTSIGLALSGLGVRVLLADSSPQVLKLAVDFGAGEKFEQGTNPKLVVVCVPPDVSASVISTELANHLDAVVTDVASVKATILSELEASTADLSRYVGSHPMAGREQAGALAGRSDIFTGRPWVISANKSSSKQSIDAVEALGVSRIPGKHGQRATEYAKITVMIEDKPGELARLLTEIGEVGINLEDLTLEHATGAAVGLPELFVLPSSEEKLVTELSARGWKIVG